MLIAVPAETDPGKGRVAATPETVKKFIGLGAKVVVQSGAGLAGNWDVESLLSDALRPLEPPERLSGRLEDTLAAVTQAAAEELSQWAEELSESELRALRDPRNWVRPVVAVGAGGAAAGALVVMELRRRGKQQAKGGLRSLTGRIKP